MNYQYLSDKSKIQLENGIICTQVDEIKWDRRNGSLYPPHDLYAIHNVSRKMAYYPKTVAIKIDLGLLEHLAKEGNVFKNENP